MSSGSETFSSSMETANAYNKWVVDTFRPWWGRATLEVGIGYAGSYDQLPAQERYVGIDVDAALVERARKLRPLVDYRQGDVADPTIVDLVGVCSFDTVLCVNVLEHVQEHRRAVENMMAMLRTSGHLLLFVPALPTLFGDLDRAAGHLRRCRRQDLTQVVGGMGTIECLRYFNPVGAIGWWLNRFVSHPTLETRRVQRQVRFFDRYLLPVSRVLDPACRSFFGQSLVCAVSKK